MRRTALILAVLGCGCTEALTAEELAFHEAEADYGAVEFVPDVAVELEAGPPAPRVLERGPVHIEISSYRFDEDPTWADGTARCPFDVRAVGLPAIREDGQSIATLSSETSGPSEGEDELVSFRVFDIETEEFSEDQSLVEGSGDRKSYDCWRWYKAAKASAAEVNDTLAQGWRPMHPLPVEVDPRLAPYGDEGRTSQRPPPHSRPVQLTVLQGQAVFRVPGVKVLSRNEDRWPRPQDDAPDEGMCWYHGPNPEEIFADAETGVALVSVRYESGPCMCDSPVYSEVIHIDAATLSEIDSRAQWVSSEG